MAWSTSTPNQNSPIAVAVENTITLPASAVVGYSSEIDFLAFDPTKEHRYIGVNATASAVTGTNLDIALYGALSKGGTKFLLLDAVVADVTNSAKSASAVIDLNLYPAPFYYLGHTADADEHLNTISYKITY